MLASLNSIVRTRIKASPLLYRAATDLRTVVRRLQLGYPTVEGLPGRVHYADLSYQRHLPHHYAVAARSAIEAIEKGLAARQLTFADVHSALDFACGYGRVLRLLVQALPHAEVHACDLVPQAVEFCRSEFGAAAFLSDVDPQAVRLPRAYDLIWVGSLFTHLRPSDFKKTMKVLAEGLNPGGTLIITTHGPFSLSILDSYGLRLPPRAQVEAQLRDDGVFFAPYLAGGDEYGFSIFQPGYVERMAAERGLALASYVPRGWDAHQDTYALTRPLDSAIQ